MSTHLELPSTNPAIQDYPGYQASTDTHDFGSAAVVELFSWLWDSLNSGATCATSAQTGAIVAGGDGVGPTRPIPG